MGVSKTKVQVAANPFMKDETTPYVTINGATKEIVIINTGTLNDFMNSEKMSTSFEMFHTYHNWLMNHIDSIHRNQFVLYSSVILYLLGNRSMNDLDLYVHSISDQDYEKLLSFHKETNFTDFRVKGRENWPNYWDSWLQEWSEKCKARYFEEMLGSPSYYFFYLGLKIISIDCDIVRRIQRYRPRAYADLIILRKKTGLSIHIPPIPYFLPKYESTTNLTQEEIRKKIEEGGILQEKNKEIR